MSPYWFLLLLPFLPPLGLWWWRTQLVELDGAQASWLLDDNSFLSASLLVWIQHVGIGAFVVVFLAIVAMAVWFSLSEMLFGKESLAGRAANLPILAVAVAILWWTVPKFVASAGQFAAMDDDAQALVLVPDAVVFVHAVKPNQRVALADLTELTSQCTWREDTDGDGGYVRIHDEVVTAKVRTATGPRTLTAHSQVRDPTLNPLLAGGLALQAMFPHPLLDGVRIGIQPCTDPTGRP